MSGDYLRVEGVHSMRTIKTKRWIESLVYDVDVIYNPVSTILLDADELYVDSDDIACDFADMILSRVSLVLE